MGVQYQCTPLFLVVLFPFPPKKTGIKYKTWLNYPLLWLEPTHVKLKEYEYFKNSVNALIKNMGDRDQMWRFLSSRRFVWMETSAACSIRQVAEEEEEEGLLRPRVALASEGTASPAIIITRDPSEIEGWRRTNRTLPHWWMECRRFTDGGPSHTHSKHTHAHRQLLIYHLTVSSFFSPSILCHTHTQEDTHFHQHGNIVVKSWPRGRLVSAV